MYFWRVSSIRFRFDELLMKYFFLVHGIRVKSYMCNNDFGISIFNVLV